MSESTTRAPGRQDGAALPLVTMWGLYGAGTNEIGNMVAEELGLPFHEQAFSSEDLENPESSLENRAVLANVLSVLGGAYGGFEGLDVVTTQEEKRDLIIANNTGVWKDAAAGGVVVGRNATVILATRPNTLHVLLTGDKRDRVRRASEYYNIPEAKAAERQSREDDIRAEMSRSLYGWDPSDAENYDLMLNTSRIPTGAVVAAIVDAIQRREGNKS